MVCIRIPTIYGQAELLILLSVLQGVQPYAADKKMLAPLFFLYVPLYNLILKPHCMGLRCIMLFTMALIKCTECGQMVSDRAANCPNCGCPVEREVICEECPVPVVKLGVYDRFGHSGPAVKLLDEFGLRAVNIVEKAKKAISMK